MIPTPKESIHRNDVIIQNTSDLPLAKTYICSSSMDILNCITSSQINGWVNIRISRGIAFPLGKKWACIYSVKKKYCCTNWRKFRSLYLIWTCYSFSQGVISYIHSKSYLWTIELQKQRIKHKRRKGNFVRLDCHESWKWQMENMHADEWRKPFKFLTNYAITVEQEYDHHFPAIGINFIVSLKVINYSYTLFERRQTKADET